MLFKDNTPSAAAFAEQCCRKADSLAECRQSDEARRTGQGRILASGRKNGLIFFWRERSLPPARFIQPSKNIPPIEYWTAYGPAAIYWLYAVPLFVFLFRLFRQSLVSAAVGLHCTDVKGKRFSG